LSWNSLFFAVYYQRVSLRYGLISCLRARRWVSSLIGGDGPTGPAYVRRSMGKADLAVAGLWGDHIWRLPFVPGQAVTNLGSVGITDRFVTEPGWSLLAVPARTWHYGHHAVAPAACDVPCTVTVRYRDSSMYLSLSINPLSFLASSSKPQKSLFLDALYSWRGRWWNTYLYITLEKKRV
jgi:hypothetical protein